MPFGFELTFEIEIIFYDTVMDDGDSGFAVDQWVRVFLDWTAVCCPAGVSDAYRAREIVKVVFGVDLVESSAILLYCECPICDRYFADRIVSSIF